MTRMWGLWLLASATALTAENTSTNCARINGEGPGWKALTKADLVNVNGNDQTWTWRDDGTLHCNGKPTSVMRYRDKIVNFEMVCEWRHLRHGGNSGIFVWTTKESIDRLAKSGRGGLPAGIKVQVLDLGYEENYRKKHNKDPDWFTMRRTRLGRPLPKKRLSTASPSIGNGSEGSELEGERPREPVLTECGVLGYRFPHGSFSSV